MIPFACPNCKRSLKVREEFAGKKIRCPKCGHAVPFPASTPAGTLAEGPHPAPARDDLTLPHQEPLSASGVSGSGSRSGQGTHSDQQPAAAEATGGTPGGPVLYDFLAPAQGPGELGRLGGYRVLKVLGSGGMGVVFHAEDPRLKRAVALKAMRPALAASASAGQRFLREAQTTAALKHDHIVTIFQVGEDRGVPFLAMEFLEGEPLDERLRREAVLPLPEVLRIGREVALGLAAAHKRGLMHRDIKPANIWLEAETGRVKILDFGLARATGDESHLTQQGAIVGTPAYMAPEQARGEEIDAHCDLFSLGCVLFRVATGKMPFTGKDSLSTLMAVVTQEVAVPRALNPDLPKAFSDLVLRLLAKDPAKRPESALAVVEALAAIEADHTMVLAPGKSLPGRVTAGKKGKAAGRPSRRRLWIGAAVALALLGGGALLVSQVFLRPDAKEEKVPEDGTVFVADPGPQPPGKVAGPFDALRRDQIPPDELAAAGGGDPRFAPSGLVAVLGVSRLKHWGDVRAVAFSPDAKRLASGGSDSTVRVWDTATGKEVLVLKGQGDGVFCVAFSPDGKRLVSGSTEVKVWEAATGKELWTLKGHKQRVRSVAFSGDSKRLATASDDKTVKVWDMATGKELRTLKGHAAEITSVAFSLNGKRLASGSKDKTVKVWDAAEGKELLTFKGHGGPITSVAFSPDGKRLASADVKSRGVKIWDAATGTKVVTLDWPNVKSVAFSPDGKRLATGYDGGGVSLWHAETGEQLILLKGHTASVKSVVYSRDGKRLASGSSDHTVRLWDPATGQEVFAARGHTGSVTSVALSRDGTCLVSASANRVVKRWEVASGKEVVLAQEQPGKVVSAVVVISPDGKRLACGGFQNSREVRVLDTATGQEVLSLKGTVNAFGVAYSPDGTHLATAGSDHLVKVWDATTGKELLSLKGHKGIVRFVSYSPDGTRLASAGDDNTVRVWDTAEGKELWKGQTPGGFRGLAFSGDNKRVATASGDQWVKVWDAATGKELFSLLHTSGVWPVAFSPDGKSLATGTRLGQVVRWDAASGKKQDQWQLQGEVNSLVFAPDGRHLITGNGNGTIYVLRLDPPLDSLRREQIPAHELAAAGSGNPKQEPAELVAVFGDSRLRHWGGVSAVAFSPDHKWVASGSKDNTVRVWDAATGNEVLVFRGHSAWVRGVAFSPTGKRLASAGYDNTALVWDARTGKIDLTLKLHTNHVLAVVFSKDGKRLATASTDKTVKVWDAASGQVRLDLKGHTGEVTSVAFSPDGTRLASGSMDKTVKLWDSATGANVLTFKGHANGVSCVAFSPDGKRLVSGSGTSKGQVKVWETATGKEIHPLKTGGILSAAFSPHGKRLATAGATDFTVRLWDAATGKELLACKGHGTGPVPSIAFDRGGKRLVSGANDRTVRLWNTATGREEPLNGAGDTGDLAALSPDGRRLATATPDSTRLWDVATGQELFRHPGNFTCVAFSPDSQQVVSGTLSLGAKVWDAVTGKEIRTLKGDPGPVKGLAFSPDGKRLVSGSNTTAMVWDMVTGKALVTFKGHTKVVFCVAFSPDGKWVASGSLDRTIKVWDAATVKGRYSLKVGERIGVSTVAFSPDGKRLAAGGKGNTVKVWDLDTAKELLTLPMDSYSVNSLAFSPDGKALALARPTGPLALYDAVSGKKLREWQLPGGVNNVVFSPEGRHLLTGNGNGTVYVLRLGMK